MITSITIRELKAQKNTIDKYVILFMFLSKSNKKEQFAKIMIIRAIHLIHNFKVIY